MSWVRIPSPALSFPLASLTGQTCQINGSVLRIQPKTFRSGRRISVGRFGRKIWFSSHRRVTRLAKYRTPVAESSGSRIACQQFNRVHPIPTRNAAFSAAILIGWRFYSDGRLGRREGVAGTPDTAPSPVRNRRFVLIPFVLLPFDPVARRESCVGRRHVKPSLGWNSRPLISTETVDLGYRRSAGRPSISRYFSTDRFTFTEIVYNLTAEYSHG